MSGGVLGLVLLAAVLHASWNLAAKHARADAFSFVWLYTCLSAAVGLPAALVDLAVRDLAWSWTLLAAPLLSALLHIAYGTVLQTGYQRADLGVVYPVARGVGPLLTMLVAVALLGERPAPLALFGALLVLAGVAIVLGVRRPGGSSYAVGLGWGAATGVTIAAYTLWDSHSVTALGLSPVSCFGLTVALQSLLMTPVALRRRATAPGAVGVLRTTWREASVIAVLSPAAYVLVLVAVQHAPVAVVAPVRESSIVIGALLAWWVFGEPDPLRRLAGAAVVLGGITLVALG